MARIMYKTYNNSNFTAAQSPVIIDVLNDLGDGSINIAASCDGPGSIIFQMSNDGINYEDQIILKNSEAISWDDSKSRFSAKKIKVTHTGADSSYRIFIF